jgi:hypothetical protein
MEIQLKWEGPYALVGSESKKSIFEINSVDSCGIYLWTTKYSTKYLVNYVGMTSKSFKQRLIEHIEYYYTGKYTVYDTKHFTNAELVARYIPKGNILDFASKYREVSTLIDDYLKTLNIFIAPLKMEKIYLKKIESAIILQLKSYNDITKRFLDNKKVSHYITTEEQELIIKIQNPEIIFGLNSTLNT